MTERTVDIRGVKICYETIGHPSGRPLLLIMGLSSQMIWWDDEFCEQLADRGFYVIRFDNRDAGRSQTMHGRTSLPRSFLRQPPPYSLADMAEDAAGLLAHLDVPSAHVTGTSMGGMITQTLAIRHPERVRSLVSIMSTTGSRLVGWPAPRGAAALLGKTATNREQYVELVVGMFRRIGSPGFPFDEARMRDRAGRSFDRGVNRSGTRRQIAAITSAHDRTAQLRRLRVPALVIHGKQDLLVNVSGGRATARAIPDSELILVPGMGHDMPRPIWPTLIDGIERTADRAGALHE
jgi:pimeloyl-ACP methyl ester carboxylesterase